MYRHLEFKSPKFTMHASILSAFLPLFYSALEPLSSTATFHRPFFTRFPLGTATSRLKYMNENPVDCVRPGNVALDARLIENFTTLPQRPFALALVV